MDPQDRPSIDELLARRVVVNYGNIHFVSIPGADLTESETAAVVAKLRYVRPTGCTRVKANVAEL